MCARHRIDERQSETVSVGFPALHSSLEEAGTDLRIESRPVVLQGQYRKLFPGVQLDGNRARSG